MRNDTAHKDEDIFREDHAHLAFVVVFRHGIYIASCPRVLAHTGDAEAQIEQDEGQKLADQWFFILLPSAMVAVMTVDDLTINGAAKTNLGLEFEVSDKVVRTGLVNL
eukprot:CAMPEP_0116088376 /NCGR_PEP_ID=MMETSP0327-20121206/5838_1 /TAXON_ID=44447 /ORGANISM="Pseudo-nitzschia delicatissima, Strain B596" /LENGTH=107 /DNA_ID=CAMNT_0003579455 /DNA_START=248 /DNA_END=573 /DNA_ORIENTATION=+